MALLPGRSWQSSRMCAPDNVGSDPPTAAPRALRLANVGGDRHVDGKLAGPLRMCDSTCDVTLRACPLQGLLNLRQLLSRDI
jgi:hypothetical protein